ncbi:hypothetical protein K504DRAFT_519863 [Pleomassaria siparia CBS 279.74]|uniref:Uncharacterized protein n=1 Tax=Pleomassaria siparia CBS 279.74 TaxID=1314801 RepID=A0A6G1JSN2_9PLEO|nr:hypothetical protein K504DRAFT_519863 [Pleomassaria siparia CBS 279.74]
MPYIIRNPFNHCVYITNNPIIFMDCRGWGWKVESCRYDDASCHTMREREKKYGLTDTQERQLELLWSQEVEKRKIEASAKVPSAVIMVQGERTAEAVQSKTVTMSEKEVLETRIHGKKPALRSSIEAVKITNVNVAVTELEGGVLGEEGLVQTTHTTA